MLAMFTRAKMRQSEQYGAAERLPKWGGGHQQKRALSEEKRAPTVGNLKAKIYNFLDIGTYPCIVITLSGMISIFVSLHASYKISLKHHTFIWVGCLNMQLRASEINEKNK